MPDPDHFEIHHAAGLILAGAVAGWIMLAVVAF